MMKILSGSTRGSPPRAGGHRIGAAAFLLTSLVATSAAQVGPNHLSGQAAPYLKRSVSQPVDWYPWGAAAFKRAKELDRPILLDVGAVWCPWCALMDRDTYTNSAEADYINQHFVAVKVDFDASPALVAQLQRAQALLNLPAGLPLTSSSPRTASSILAPDICLLSARGINVPFGKRPGKLSGATAIEPLSKKSHFNWRLQSRHEDQSVPAIPGIGFSSAGRLRNR